MRKISLILVLVFFAAAALTAFEPLAVIKNNIVKRGGSVRYSNLKSLRVVGKIVSEGVEFPTVFTWKAPDKFKFQNMLGGNEAVTVLVADSGWMIDPTNKIFEPVKLTEKEFDQMKPLMLSIFNYLNYDLYRYMIHYDEQTSMKPATSSDSSNFIIKLDDGHGNSIEYYFDNTTFLDTKHEITLSYLPVPLHITFKDYFTLDGVTLPRTIESQVGDSRKAKVTIDNIKIDTEISDDIFKIK